MQNFPETVLPRSPNWMTHSLRSFILGCLAKNSELFSISYFVLWFYRSSHRRCFVKKVLLKISQNSQENTCTGVSFYIKVAGLRFNFILCNEKLSLRLESFELAIFFKLSQHFSRQYNILILFFCYLLLSFLRQIVSKFLFCSIFS